MGFTIPSFFGPAVVTVGEGGSIAAALDALPSTGGIVALQPATTYSFAEPLTLPPNVSILGGGASSILSYTGPELPDGVIRLGATRSDDGVPHLWRIEDIQIQRPDADGAYQALGGAAIKISGDPGRGGATVVIRGLTLLNFTNSIGVCVESWPGRVLIGATKIVECLTGIDAHASPEAPAGGQLLVRNARFANMRGRGMVVQGLDGARVSGCWFENSCLTALSLAGVRDCSITASRFEGNARLNPDPADPDGNAFCVRFWEDAPSRPEDALVAVIVVGDFGLPTASGTFACNGVNISGCYFKCSWLRRAIWLRGASSVSLIGNTFYDFASPEEYVFVDRGVTSPFCLNNVKR